MPDRRTHIARPVLAVEELATVLAALAFWQRNVIAVSGTFPSEWKIATGDHQFRPLDYRQIEALRKRIERA